ncbi:MAG: hypothetical protein ABI682_04420 [Acidobacteriota bacterium]
MKAYVVTTGALFALLMVAHLARMFQERNLATDPWYVSLTVAAALMCVWAWRVLRRPSKQ